MKIAVITDDSNIISAHFGRAQQYDVFTIEDDQIVKRETRPKANHSQFNREHHHDHEHGQGHGIDPASQHRHNAMIEPINDCQVLIARGMGKGAHQSLTESGIRPILTQMDNIEEAVKSFIAGTLADHPEKLH